MTNIYLRTSHNALGRKVNALNLALART